MKACPSCRSGDVYLIYTRSSEWHHVRCLMCGMQGPQRRTCDLAVEAWDALPRHEDADELLALVEAAYAMEIGNQAWDIRAFAAIKKVRDGLH